MGIQLIEKVQPKKILQKMLSNISRSSVELSPDIPKGHVAVYVGETYKKQYVIPIPHLNQPLFQNVLHVVEEEFRVRPSHGRSYYSLQEDYFSSLISLIRSSS